MMHKAALLLLGWCVAGCLGLEAGEPGAARSLPQLDFERCSLELLHRLALTVEQNDALSALMRETAAGDARAQVRIEAAVARLQAEPELTDPAMFLAPDPLRPPVSLTPLKELYLRGEELRTARWRRWIKPARSALALLTPGQRHIVDSFAGTLLLPGAGEAVPEAPADAAGEMAVPGVYPRRTAYYLVNPGCLDVVSARGSAAVRRQLPPAGDTFRMEAWQTAFERLQTIRLIGLLHLTASQVGNLLPLLRAGLAARAQVDEELARARAEATVALQQVREELAAGRTEAATNEVVLRACERVRRLELQDRAAAVEPFEAELEVGLTAEQAALLMEVMPGWGRQRCARLLFSPWAIEWLERIRTGAPPTGMGDPASDGERRP